MDYESPPESVAPSLPTTSTQPRAAYPPTGEPPVTLPAHAPHRWENSGGETVEILIVGARMRG